MLFVDYSSAFNTIIPSTLTSKLEVLGLSLPLCQWISNFLTDRPQAVRFADDTVVVDLISNNDKTAYLQETKNLGRWCQENNLLLNVSKTKELIVDFSTKQERLPSQVLKTFYTCTIESVLTSSITSWFGNSTMQDRRALQRVVRSAERTIHTELPDLKDIYSTWCRTRARKIVKDLRHPNNGLFSLLRSGKRIRSLKANTERMRRSFFPQAIRILNQETPRI
ncbi:uncharacterized protein LOC109141784, partial [Tachysurus ichikawai]